MTTKNHKTTSGVRAHSWLLQLYEQGFTPEQMKETILATLIPEFNDSSILERYDIGLLCTEYVNITKIKQVQWVSELYDECTRIRRKSLRHNPNLCAEICANWEQQISGALSVFWSSANLEQDKTELPIEDFAYDVFRIIGSLIEGTLQVYLKELLHVRSIQEPQSLSFDYVNELSLGTVVRELENMVGKGHFLTLQPWGIPLNQWRNIGQHFSIVINDSQVHCRYGAKNQHHIALSRAEVLEVARALFLAFSAFRTSHTIFFLENADALVAHCKGFKRRESDQMFEFAVAAASQGFEVKDIKLSEGIATAVLADVTDQDIKKRAIHASQFGYELWMRKRTERAAIEYVTKQGKLYLRATMQAVDCERVYNGEKELEWLAQVVHFQIMPEKITSQ